MTWLSHVSFGSTVYFPRTQSAASQTRFSIIFHLELLSKMFHCPKLIHRLAIFKCRGGVFHHHFTTILFFLLLLLLPSRVCICAPSNLIFSGNFQDATFFPPLLWIIASIGRGSRECLGIREGFLHPKTPLTAPPHDGDCPEQWRQKSSILQSSIEDTVAFFPPPLKWKWAN